MTIEDLRVRAESHAANGPRCATCGRPIDDPSPDKRGAWRHTPPLPHDVRMWWCGSWSKAVRPADD